jgi:hypothetical protein
MPGSRGKWFGACPHTRRTPRSSAGLDISGREHRSRAASHRHPTPAYSRPRPDSSARRDQKWAIHGPYATDLPPGDASGGAGTLHCLRGSRHGAASPIDDTGTILERRGANLGQAGVGPGPGRLSGLPPPRVTGVLRAGIRTEMARPHVSLSAQDAACHVLRCQRRGLGALPWARYLAARPLRALAWRVPSRADVIGGIVYRATDGREGWRHSWPAWR